PHNQRRIIIPARIPRIVNQRQNRRAPPHRVIHHGHRLNANNETLNIIANLPTQVTNNFSNLANVDHLLVEEFFNGSSFVQTIF
ncbi:8268_t:CDS:1, partial [Funneliformis geosporum]